MTIGEIIEKIKKFPHACAVITGGEPLIHPQLPLLTNALAKQNFHITVETTGIIFRKIKCDLLSLSPKPPKAFNPSAIKKLIKNAPDYQIKFVIEDKKNILQIRKILKNHKFIDRGKVMLMPNAKTLKLYKVQAPKIAKLSLHENLRFSPRLHLETKLK